MAIPPSLAAVALAVLETWTPLSVLLVVGALGYVATQCIVAIIRARRGDNQPTALDQQVAAGLAALRATVVQHETRLTQVGEQVGDIAKDFVPPQAVNDVIRSQVLQYLAQFKAQAAAARPAAPPQAATVIVQAPATPSAAIVSPVTPAPAPRG